MKRCLVCGKHIDIGTQSYVNVYPRAVSEKMETYHLDCFTSKIVKEKFEEVRS
ncbi:MAG: hypothetical protein ACYCT2_04375 [Thermoplasmataceae archaeon]